MPAPVLAERLRGGETLYCGWCTLPESLVAELLARQPFDAVAVEMQHAPHDNASAMRSIAAICHVGKPAAVRIPWGANATASWVLDMGAQAVIAPMINSADDARALVAATKYPPIGERSWGPPRAMALLGIETPAKQLETANDYTLTFAMIETDRGIGALDDILSVQGIDGVFVGPSDLSVTISDGQKITPTEAWLDDSLSLIAEKANAARRIAGIYAVNTARARRFRELGYRFITLGSDQVHIASGANAMLDEVRKGA
jgi:4-hydroxy-2-oxoheptanedioate aldolase